MTDNKTPRSAQTRVTEERRKPWKPPSQLDAPPCPDGYKQRWLRHRVNGMDDTKNVNARLREGWELVRSDSHTEGQYSAYNGSIKAYEGVISWETCFWQECQWKQLMSVMHITSE